MAQTRQAAESRRPEPGTVRVDGLVRLAVERERSGDLAGALDAYARAMDQAPSATAFMPDLGRLALKLQMPEAAETFFRRHLDAEPGTCAAQDGLARALKDQHRYGEAIEVLRAAITANPAEPIPWNTLGTVLAQKGDSATAATFFDEALRLDPGFVQALHNRSGARMDAGDLAGALADCDAALALVAETGAGDGADAAMMRFARATLLLCQGELERGWAAYDARFAPAYPGRAEFRVAARRWTRDQPLRGASILMVGEQGLGDEVMFSTLLSDLLDAVGPGGRVALAVEPRLQPLLARSYPGIVVGAHATRREGTVKLRSVPDIGLYGAIDGWAPLGDLLARFRPRPDAFPTPAPKLAADPARVRRWREVLADGPEALNVGLTWRSGLLTGERRRQYAPLAAWREALKTPGVRFVNLQYGDCEAELDALRRDFSVEVWRPPGLDIRQDLDGVAALASALDLVAGCANATTHIAAACGARTWIVSPPSAWSMLGTDRLPWYRETRAFTAPAFDDWTPPLSALAAALAEAALARTAAIGAAA